MNILEQLKTDVQKATTEPPKAPKPGSDIRRADIPPKGGAWLIETPRKRVLGLVSRGAIPQRVWYPGRGRTGSYIPGPQVRT